MNVIIFLMGMIFLLTFTSGLGVEIERDVPVTNINSSDYWITNIGALSGVNDTQFDDIGGLLTIDVSWLSNFITGIGTGYCLLTGCTFSGNVNMGTNDITNAGNITADNFNGGDFIGDGSGLTGITHPSVNSSEFMFTNGTNAQPIVDFSNSVVNAINVTANHIEVGTINGTNATFENVNITKNSTLYIGGVALSTQGTFEGKRVLSITDNNTGDDVFIDAFAYLGSGFYLENISFENGTVIANAFNASEFFGGDFVGNNFTGVNASFENYDLNGVAPWIIFDGKNISFNDSYLNDTILDFIANLNTSALNFTSITLNGTTIQDFSEINYTVSNGTVLFTTPSFTGVYSVILPENFHFEIAQLTVNPSTTTGNYRFAVYEAGSGETIEADIISHTSQWSIFKSYPIDNQISINMTNSGPSKTFDITIKYFQNVAN